jgi:hypothetical protein
MMSMKTILVPTENHDAMQSALETALLLARRCDSYMEGFALRWAINEFIGGDIVGGIPLERYKRDIADEAKKARQIFESYTQKHNVPPIEAGAVLLPSRAAWLDEFRRELLEFPNGRHDDQVDALSQGLQRAYALPTAPVAASAPFHVAR